MTDVNTIFCAGFVLGAVFAYSGIMGFVSGCLTGFIIAKNYITEQKKLWEEIGEQKVDLPTFANKLLEKIKLFLQK